MSWYCKPSYTIHDDVIKWKHFPRNWPLMREIHRSPVNSPHKGQWRGVLMFSLICVWINDWVNNREAGDLRRYRAHYDVIVMRSMRAYRNFSCDYSVQGVSPFLNSPSPRLRRPSETLEEHFPHWKSGFCQEHLLKISFGVVVLQHG